MLKIGDGLIDVVVDSWGNNRIALIEGDGTGQLVGTRQMFSVGRRPYQRLRTADFNRDGRADIVTTNLDDGTVTILLGDGRGGFREAEGSPFAAGAAPWQVAIADVNGDGQADLIVIPYDRDVRERSRIAVTILLGDGAGRFRPTRTLPLDRCAGANAVAGGDLRHNGQLDIVVNCANTTTLRMFRAQADGAYVPSSIPIGRGPTWGGVAVADLDGDGTDDIVVSNSVEGVIRILFNEAADTNMVIPRAPGGRPDPTSCVRLASGLRSSSIWSGIISGVARAIGSRTSRSTKRLAPGRSDAPATVCSPGAE